MSDTQQMNRDILVSAISDYCEENCCAVWLMNIVDIVRGIGGKWITMAVAAGGWPTDYFGAGEWIPVTDEEIASAVALGYVVFPPPLTVEQVEQYIRIGQDDDLSVPVVYMPRALLRDLALTARRAFPPADDTYRQASDET